MCTDWYLGIRRKTLLDLDQVVSETKASNVKHAAKLGWAYDFRPRLEFARHFDRFAGALTPFIALELADLRSNGFNETAVSGPGLLALNVAGQSSASVPSFIAVPASGV